MTISSLISWALAGSLGMIIALLVSALLVLAALRICTLLAHPHGSSEGRSETWGLNW